jgi:hypothetical protein
LAGGPTKCKEAPRQTWRPQLWCLVAGKGFEPLTFGL